MRLGVFIIFLIDLPFNVAVIKLFYNFQIMQALFDLKILMKTPNNAFFYLLMCNSQNTLNDSNKYLSLVRTTKFIFNEKSLVFNIKSYTYFQQKLPYIQQTIA